MIQRAAYVKHPFQKWSLVVARCHQSFATLGAVLSNRPRVSNSHCRSESHALVGGAPLLLPTHLASNHQHLLPAIRRLSQMASGLPPISSDELQSRQKTLHALESTHITLNLLPSGIAVPKALAEGIDHDAAEFLNKASGAAQHLAFSGLFSSILAGPANESDEYVDVPVYLGHLSSDVAVDTNWLKAQLAPESQLPIKVRRSSASVQVNSHELELFSSLDSSLKQDPTFKEVSELLAELAPGSIHIFELGDESTTGGKTACCLFGERAGHWVGLVGCRVAT
ncbi:hypothetical protein CROQUDRAFT_664078 [Cronartium quercuum f. sp. fusiforme G11]|uniref:Uncharacterized protein n=1 Tax=Cronartium quercuum f. sp. fusiforme G11 TaxID=708437 RepID=A0A9P6N8G5_9BASI|nr:hypothetical protein CROQUDRAFT_664078 [Cronartium quercuum f. sp. fusiforme G11]